MGPEVLIVPLSIVGALLCGLLGYRSLVPASRPFALPTFVAALLWAYYGAVEFRKPDDFWTYFFLSFVGGAVLFGLHAHAIKWLIARSTNVK
jgi:hypothetical protein